MPSSAHIHRQFKRIYAARYLYFIYLPVIAFFVIFAYAPMFNLDTGGILMSFTRYTLRTSFLEMEWVGFHWFRVLWSRPDFWEAFRNTLLISFGRLLIEFPFPIIIAIILNEVRGRKKTRILQTIFTFPFFLSWIIVYSILQDLFQFTGVINSGLRALGHEPFMFLANNSTAANLLMLFGTNIWRSAGWGAIIYIATISGIDPTLYEAAKVDGANRWHCIRYITLPGLKATMIILFILQIGAIMNGGFDQIFQFRNAVNRPVIEILDTYVFHYGFGGQMNQAFAAAAGLFRSVINFALLLTADRFAKFVGTDGLF